jgi:precorrin-6Y C5,15-methyltransferase (decarboxylating)
VAIEWRLRHPANRAIAIEERPDRAGRIGGNAKNLGRRRSRSWSGARPRR